MASTKNDYLPLSPGHGELRYGTPVPIISNPADLVALDPESFGDVDARRASGEVAHVGRFTAGQLDGRYCAIHIEHAIPPDDTTLFVDEREAPVVNVVHDP